MKRSRWPWVVGFFTGLGLLAAAGSASGSTGGNGSSGNGSGGGATFAARWAVLEPHALTLELATGWNGLAEFLRIVAFQESKAVLDIWHDGGIGRGPFALHATVGAVQRLGACDEAPAVKAATTKEAKRTARIACGKSVLHLLTDPRVAVATAADYAHSLTRLTYHYQRSDTRWRDIDAGWAIPTWTGNRDAPPFCDSKGNCKTRAAVVSRFEQRAKELGTPALPGSLALGSVDWPGLKAALVLLDSPHASRVID